MTTYEKYCEEFKELVTEDEDGDGPMNELEFALTLVGDDKEMRSMEIGSERDALMAIGIYLCRSRNGTTPSQALHTVISVMKQLLDATPEGQHGDQCECNECKRIRAEDLACAMQGETIQ